MKIDSATSLYAVIGHPVRHSLSPVMHNFLFQKYKINAVYLAFDISPNDLRIFFQAMRVLPVAGCNITLPHKTNAFKFLDKIDTSAQAVSAVNTVVNKNGKLVGYNTDIYGIEMTLKNLKVDIPTSTFLVLGAGGAARAVIYCLVRHKSPQIYLANRTYVRALNLKNLIARTFPHSVIKALPLDDSHLKKIISEVDCIINATSLGIKPDDPSPLPVEFIRRRHKIFDLTYNPDSSALIRFSRKKGCRAIDGLPMLVWQGLKAFNIWTNIQPDFNSVYRKLKTELK